MPRVSICIPSYNHEKYVAQTIQSILEQTYQDFEVIITDDGSVDRTVEEIQKFNDPRIQLFTFEKNQGACVAANHCIRKATGEFIGVLSSDDEYLPHKLDTQVRFLNENPNIGAVFSYAQIIDQNGGDVPNDNPHKKTFIKENRSRYEWLTYFFTWSNCLCHPSILIRKSCYDTVGLYDPRLCQLPDFDMWVRLCTYYDIHVIPENLIKFRVHQDESNASGRNPKSLSRLPLEFYHVLNHYLEPEIIRQFPQVFPSVIQNMPEFHPELAPFYLAIIALQVGQIPNKLFGLQTLYEFLKNDRVVEKLTQYYNFTYASFLDLTSQYDLFRAIEIGSIEYVPPRQTNEFDHGHIVDQLVDQLTTVNLIIFPDWQQPDDVLHESLINAMRMVIAHPDITQLTLLVYAGDDIEVADASLAISGALMSLAVEDDVDLDVEPQIVVIGALEESQWKLLATHLSARIALGVENNGAIATSGLDNFPVYPVPTP